MWQGYGAHLSRSYPAQQLIESLPRGTTISPWRALLSTEVHQNALTGLINGLGHKHFESRREALEMIGDVYMAITALAFCKVRG